MAVDGEDGTTGREEGGGQARPGGCGTGGRRKREEDRKINKELGMDGCVLALCSVV